MQLEDLHGDHPGATISVRPANLVAGVKWEFEELPGQWRAYSPPDLMENIEGSRHVEAWVEYVVTLYSRGENTPCA